MTRAREKPRTRLSFTHCRRPYTAVNEITVLRFQFLYSSFFGELLAAGCFLFASKAFNSQMLDATAKIAVSDIDDSVEDDINDADECNYKIYSDIPEENLQNEEINKSENDNL